MMLVSPSHEHRLVGASSIDTILATISSDKWRIVFQQKMEGSGIVAEGIRSAGERLAGWLGFDILPAGNWSITQYGRIEKIQDQEGSVGLGCHGRRERQSLWELKRPCVANRDRGNIKKQNGWKRVTRGEPAAVNPIQPP
jgi:hypothetical protein